MRFVLRILLIAALAYAAGLYLPWWSVAIAAFLVGLLLSERRKRRVFTRKQAPPPRSFLAGFLAMALLWGGLALYAHLQNEGVLTSRMLPILMPGQDNPSPALLIGGVGLIGGLLGGMSALTGNLLGEAIKN
ncbi:MAG: hypothetical protein D6722_19965 [Bacteroidetes bacterium]|nr:MAG: hypothetical protein D6722_19965 [Bacteroidota bacterium]